MRKIGWTHKWQKSSDHPWKYLRYRSRDEVAQGRVVLTFTDEGDAFRSYYEDQVVEL